MIEACSPVNANVGLLAYSPLAGGALTGKYLDRKNVDKAARMNKYVGYMHRYISPPAMKAVKRYKEVADAFSLPLAPLALSWVYSKVYSEIVLSFNIYFFRCKILFNFNLKRLIKYQLIQFSLL